MQACNEIKYVKEIPKKITGVSGADIGGTNSNFGVFLFKQDKLKLLLSLHCKSQEITNFTQLVQDILDYIKNKYDIQISNVEREISLNAIRVRK